jgi:thiamine pyrophosphokinase
MAKCIIFGAAEFDCLREEIKQDDLLIAADGGLVHFEKINRAPDVILGDFDSLGYTPEGARVFPVEKDDTDVMLAIRHGLAAGYREFLIYGGMDGKRLDHTIANLQALSFLREQDARGFLVGREQTATVIKNEQAIFENCKGILSVFCTGAPAESVTIRGMQYELENGTLTADFPLGVSNHFVGKTGEVAVTSGKLLLIWDGNNPLPIIG